MDSKLNWEAPIKSCPLKYRYRITIRNKRNTIAAFLEILGSSFFMWAFQFNLLSIISITPRKRSSSLFNCVLLGDLHFYF